MLLALSACQTTPDEEFIVKKDTERMVEQAADDSAGTKVSKLKVPDGNYAYSTSAADGKDSPSTWMRRYPFPNRKRFPRQEYLKPALHRRR